MERDQAAAVRRWKRGHELAAERGRDLAASEGPRPARAVAEAMSAVNALATMGVWPGPRDAVSEAGFSGCATVGRGSRSVRSKRGAGDRRLEEALADLAKALNATRAPWMIIGGIAVIARGVRRMTTDIDAAVRGDQADVGSLLSKSAREASDRAANR